MIAIVLQLRLVVYCNRVLKGKLGWHIPLMAKSQRGSQLADQIRGTGRRMTKARQAVIACLESAGLPLTHKQIARALREQGFEQTTVWRNLMMLVELGMVHRRELGDHLWRYELVRVEAAGPALAVVYFSCLSCSGLTPVSTEATPTLLQQSLPGVGRISEALLRGVCCDCAKAVERSGP